MIDSIKDRLARDELTMAVGVGRIMHHNLLQMIGLQGGFHALWFDLEHIGLSTKEVEVAVLAARSQGLDSFVRVAPTDYATVTRFLETGTGGVMAAQIFSKEQAEEFVQWTKYAPEGRRGLNSGCIGARFGTTPLAEYCAEANRNTFVAIQIETAESVEECEAIAAIEGVDMLFVGPADLSQSLGVTGEYFDEKCLSAIDRVANACRKHHKHWGAVCATPEHADLMIEKGCKLLSPASDAKIINAGIQSVKSQYSKYFA